MGLYQRLAGVVNTFFQIGGPNGPLWNANGSALEAKNAASALTVVRGATPVGDSDLTTKQYVDTLSKPIPVTAEWNGGSALPPNSANEHYYVVTTSGSFANIGDLLWDDGTGTGTVTRLLAKIGTEIITTTSFTTGAVILAGNQDFVWSGTAWVTIAAGCIDFSIGFGASQSSPTNIPQNAVVLSCLLRVLTPYTASATIAIGQTGSPNLLQAPADNFPTLVDDYLALQRTSWGSTSLPILVTVAGATGGSGIVTVTYTPASG